MPEDPRQPLPSPGAATHEGDDHHSAEDATRPAAVTSDGALAALIELVDRQIICRRNELDELIRVRRLLIGNRPVSTG